MKIEYQKLVYNRFESIKDICSKNGLIWSLRRYYHGVLGALEQDYTVFETTPRTFVIESYLDLLQFKSVYQDICQSG